MLLAHEVMTGPERPTSKRNRWAHWCVSPDHSMPKRLRKSF